MSILKEFRVTLETVTPLFLGGAKQEPEIRAPSFRGGMRYWLRALLGVQYAANLTKIHEIEEEVFGNTKQSSSISIRAWETTATNPQDFQNFKDIEEASGQGYLLWTAKRAGRQALPADTTEIELEMKCKKHEEFGCASFWLLVHLGGLGTRARRGLGSLFVKEVDKWNSEFPPLKFGGGDYQKFLADGIDTWLRILNLQPADLKVLPKFDILHPSYSGVYVCQTNQENWTDWETALEGLGNLLKNFRNKTTFKSDHDGVLKVIQGTGKPQTVERAIFGLPMQFYFSDYHRDFMKKHSMNKREAFNYATARIVPSSRNQDKRLERRASPIHFKFARLDKNSLILTATFFKSEFLPDNFELRISPGGKDQDLKEKPKFAAPPKYSVLENFFSDSKWQLVYGGNFKRQP